MRGHTEVERIRMAGRLPKIVFVNDYPCKTDWFETGEHATVCTHRDEIGGIDFRFLKGLTVSISSESESRAKRLFDRAKKDGASVVAACHVQPGVGLMNQSGWTEIYRKPEENEEGQSSDAIS